MLDGQPHGNGSIVYMANDKFGRANYTGLETKIFSRYYRIFFRGVAIWNNHGRGNHALEKRGKVSMLTIVTLSDDQSIGKETQSHTNNRFL